MLHAKIQEPEWKERTVEVALRPVGRFLFTLRTAPVCVRMTTGTPAPALLSIRWASRTDRAKAKRPLLRVWFGDWCHLLFKRERPMLKQELASIDRQIAELQYEESESDSDGLSSAPKRTRVS